MAENGRIPSRPAPFFQVRSWGDLFSLNVAPRDEDCTVMVPPCSSAIFFTMASPSPVPPFLPLVTNDWKRRCSISFGMPGPVSEKETTSAPSFLSRVTLMTNLPPPVPIASAALRARL